MEAEATRSEEDAQKAYEDFVKEANASIEAIEQWWHEDCGIEECGEINPEVREEEEEKRQHSEQITKGEDLTMRIDAVTKAIDPLKAKIVEVQMKMRHTGEEREKDNTRCARHM